METTDFKTEPTRLIHAHDQMADQRIKGNKKSDSPEANMTVPGVCKGGNGMSSKCKAHKGIVLYLALVLALGDVALLAVIGDLR